MFCFCEIPRPILAEFVNDVTNDRTSLELSCIVAQTADLGCSRGIRGGGKDLLLESGLPEYDMLGSDVA